MQMPNFTKTVMLTDSQGHLCVLSYTESDPFIGLCGQVPSTLSLASGGQAMPVNMFQGSSVTDIIDQAKVWIG